MDQNEGKLKSLPLVEKLKLIQIIESGRSVKDVAEQFSINRNTLHYIFKNKDKIRNSLNLNPGTASFKRIKQTKSPELEKRVLNFMYESQSRNERLSGNVIKSMALEIAEELHIDNFAASNGWLFSFFKRNLISIQEFNQGIDNQKPLLKADTDSDTSHDMDHCSWTVEELIEVEKPKTYSIHPFEVDNEDFEHSEKENDEIFVPETIKEEEESLFDKAWCSEWRNWCRMCGNEETLIEVDQFLADIAQHLFDTSFIDYKICTECNASLEYVSKMISKAQVVASMFIELDKREKEQKQEVDLVEIRRQFGLQNEEPEVEIDYIEELMEEQDNTYQTIEDSGDVIIHEDVESVTTCEDQEVGPEEHIEDDIVKEEIYVTNEDIKPSSQSKRLAHEDSFEYKCHICGNIYERMFSLSNHTRNVHHSLPKVACTCGRYLSTWESLMTHKRLHSSDQNNFTCDLCEATFKTTAGLKIHCRFKHEKVAPSFACATCGREFKDGSVLKAHQRTHLPDEEKFTHECDICGKRMVTQWSLKHHIKAIHERSVNHFCHLCGRGFVDKSNLRSHLISHTTENVTCKECGGKFKNRVSLQGHKKTHRPKHLRNFSCDLCDKTFHNRNHLNRHMISHSDHRSFKCSFPNCTNEYKWQKDLLNHIAAVHTGERPCKCPFCDRAFVDNGNLRKHKLKDHSKELAAFESQFGKRPRMNQVFTEQFEEVVE